ncbi:hypothetical protein KIN20_000968 [Parelaphostrongylus tenuis]|uniref:SSD domain-containing protein n=1 Tax=Parelaphostrongylus tenuis TaxID=148309 RepID=A0AAD5MC36_PARTN|nr:hypothetical protein KIN20_000968 [Parelaphostrongylus tenuis]
MRSGTIYLISCEGKPWYMALFAEPRDESKGSMTNSREFNEFEKFYKAITTSITIREENNRSITYMDYCDPTCNINDQIFKTHSLAWFGLQWPQTDIFSYKSNIGKYFFLREMKGDEIIRARLSALYFMAFINSSQAANDMRNFEEQVSLWVADHNANASKITTITQHSARGMQLEITRGMKFVAGELLGGIVLTILFILASFIVLNKIRGRSNSRVAVLSFASSVLPIMSLVNALAACSFFGMHMNAITVLAPALAFAIGADGVLMFYNAWISVHIHSNVKDHMTAVFAAIAPSVTIVSGTSLGLIAGILFPIEEFATFSCYLGVTVVFLYMSQIFFFPAVMVWGSPLVTHRPLARETPPLHKMPKEESVDVILGRYAHFLTNSSWTKILIVPLLLGLALPTYLGFAEIKANIDYRDFLPADSPSNRGVRFMSDIVWPEFFNVIFFIEKPPQFDDSSSYQRFKEMISEIESLPGNIKDAGMMWTNDFQRHTRMIGNETVLNMTQFEDFITHYIYKAWNSGVRYRLEGNKSVITRMLYVAAFEGVRSTMDKAVLLSCCRKIAAKYPEFDTVPFDTEVAMVDVILQIPYVTFCIPLIVIVIYSVLSLVIIGNLAVSCVAIFSIASIYLESYCISSLMGMKLNPFSSAFLLIVAACSSTHATHICYTFQKVALENHYANDMEHRLAKTFKILLIPVALSKLCGFLVFVPMIFTNVAVFRWLAVINLCCLLIGAIHALFLIPLILSCIPISLTGHEFLCTAKKDANLELKSLNN